MRQLPDKHGVSPSDMDDEDNREAQRLRDEAAADRADYERDQRKDREEDDE